MEQQVKKTLDMDRSEILTIQMSLQCFIEDNEDQVKNNPYGFNKLAIDSLKEMVASAKSALNKIVTAAELEPLATLEQITVADALPFLTPYPNADNNQGEVPGTV